MEITFQPPSSKVGEAQTRLSPGEKSQSGPSVTRSPYVGTAKLRGSELRGTGAVDWANDRLANTNIAKKLRQQKRLPTIAFDLLGMETTVRTILVRHPQEEWLVKEVALTVYRILQFFPLISSQSSRMLS